MEVSKHADLASRAICTFALVFLIAAMISEPAMAGPGGKIASAAFESFWGRIALGLLTIVFLPLILSVIIREKLAERRTRKDLRYMARYSSKFDWIKIQQRAKDCFSRIHSAWSDEELSGVSDWMTDWYWQNQQMTQLDRWKRDGLVNVCEVRKIKNMRPLLFVHKNQRQNHEDSMIVISIEASMKDYLMRRDSGAIVEGSNVWKDVETVWCFTMEGGEWKVSDIDEDEMSLVYAKMTKELPAIESTISSSGRL